MQLFLFFPSFFFQDLGYKSCDVSCMEISIKHNSWTAHSDSNADSGAKLQKPLKETIVGSRQNLAVPNNFFSILFCFFDVFQKWVLSRVFCIKKKERKASWWIPAVLHFIVFIHGWRLSLFVRNSHPINDKLQQCQGLNPIEINRPALLSSISPRRLWCLFLPPSKNWVTPVIFVNVTKVFKQRTSNKFNVASRTQIKTVCINGAEGMRRFVYCLFS